MAFWYSTKEKLPEIDTPVLIVLNGNIIVGELRREFPGFEDTYKAFDYWDDPYTDGQDWDYDEVSHWQHLPSLPKDYEKYDSIFHLFTKECDTVRLEISSVSFSTIDGFIESASVINGGWWLVRSGDHYNACDNKDGEHPRSENLFSVTDYRLDEQIREIDRIPKPDIDFDNFDDDISF